MKLEEKGTIFRKRFLQESFGQFLQVRNEYALLFNALSNEDIKKLEEKNVYFCRSYSPSCVTQLKNTPSVEVLQLIIFEAEHLKKMSPEEVVAIILHEIGHVFNPAETLEQSEFNADDFAISKGYGKHIKSSLEISIKDYPNEFDNEINRNRLKLINSLNETT